MPERLNYGEAILKGFQHLLREHPEVFVLGQGLWSPWYVGNSMTDLEKDFGKDRVIDTPVSELACTGAAVGASLCGYRPVVVHPRMDFMLYAMDPIVNQAAKWSHMLGGQAHPAVTIRGIVNRGGEQGAQHSQSLHAWFANIPGLRVVMPATPNDAKNLLIASVLCDDPVVYIDDRWLYDEIGDVNELPEADLRDITPRVLRPGDDLTLVGSSYSTRLCLDAADILERENNVTCEVIDLRVISPLRVNEIVKSVNKTGHLLAVDGGWETCGLAGEVIARVTEDTNAFTSLKKPPGRISLPATPAPTSKPLEAAYYPIANEVAASVMDILS